MPNRHNKKNENLLLANNNFCADRLSPIATFLINCGLIAAWKFVVNKTIAFCTWTEIALAVFTAGPKKYSKEYLNLV